MITVYFNMIRRWFWLVAIAAIVAGITTYWFSYQQPDLYEAKTRLIVGPGIDSPNPDLNALRTGGQLMQTYAQLVTTGPTLQAAIDDLGLDIRATTLGNYVEVKSNEETQTLAITVQDEDPGQAVAIANAIADILVRLSPSNPNSSEAKIKEKMYNEASILESNISTIEATIKQLEADFDATTNDAEKQRLILEQISQERNRLSDTHRTLTLLLGSLQDASTNQVKIIEPAARAELIDSHLQLKVLIGAMTGLVLGLVIALAFEFLDDTIKTGDELTQVAGVPLLGTIAKHKNLHGTGRERLVVEELPESRAAENYRMLGTKLLSKHSTKSAHHRILVENYDKQDPEQLPFTGNYPLHSVVVSSFDVSDEVGEIASNLAVVLAQTGHRAILVDAHLHRPTIGQLFGLAHQSGLTDVLTEPSKTPEPIPIDWAPGLSVLPSGPVPSSPFELLASTRMTDLIEELESQADIVIIAASPLLSFADSLILASRVDGAVIIAHNSKTRRNMVGDAIKSLHSLNANIIGTVLNYNHSWRLPLLSWPAVPPASTEGTVTTKTSRRWLTKPAIQDPKS